MTQPEISSERFIDAAWDFWARSGRGNLLEKGNYTIGEDNFDTTVCQETGRTIQMPTTDFLGGVAYKLAEGGFIPPEDASTAGMALLSYCLGLTIGTDRQPRRD